MSNSWFQFKQFTIHQDKCAMKVTTDASLFGAWVAAHVKKLPAKLLYDLGTGTGLLSMMLAQARSDMRIVAVDIEEAAVLQARNNAAASPFAHQIEVLQQDIRWMPAEPKADFIISNPPFHELQLSSIFDAKNIAHHSDALLLEELFLKAKSLLAANGQFAVLLPFYRKQAMLTLAAELHFTVVHGCDVRQTPKHDLFRTMAIFAHGTAPHATFSKMSIGGEHEQYDPAFVQLLKDYYLKL